MMIRNSHRRLNSFVTELLAAKPDQHRRRLVYDFENPRRGWVFFRTTARLGKTGTAKLYLESGSKRIALTSHGSPGTSTSEAMRHLRKGRHRLRLAQKGECSVSSLVVRAIPEILYANYPSNPHLKEYGSYDWDYLGRIGMLGNVNTIITGSFGDWAREWAKRGGKVVQQVGVPGLRREETVTVESAYDYWARTEGMTHPCMSGVIADEFPAAEGKMDIWATAVKRLARKGRGRSFYAYIGGEPARLRPFIEPLLGQANCCFANERYLKEQPTEEMAKQFLERELKRDLEGYKAYAPDFQKRLILVLGLLCGPPESLNTRPGASYKVYMDMQFHLIASDPAFDGIYGIEEYLSSYADEEYLRWAAKLYRHYCIEGKRTRLSSDPYVLNHLENPDFEDGLKGWRVMPAEPGSIDTRSMEGLGWLQGRFTREGEGDRFLWMRRCANRPNVVSQTVKNLQPGRPYSLKLYVADYLELTKNQKHSVRVRMEGVDLVTDKCFHAVYPNCYSHHIPRFGDRNTYFNFIRLVFYPRAPRAELSISDWTSDDQPGGAVGQELMYNFVEIEPYLID